MYTLPNLPYEYNALEPYIDTETMHLHHDKHHATYIKNVNDALASYPELLSMDIIDLIRSLDKVPEDIRQKVKNNAGGHANHTLFWNSLTPTIQQPEGELVTTINNTFGNLDTFKEQFTQKALARFGSGWAWLVVDNGKLAITDTANQDSPYMQGQTPILGLDVWEHAYYLKYQNRRADYITAFFTIINWQNVQNEYLKALK
jgi:Fe-Mn family superoxide dismutase